MTIFSGVSYGCNGTVQPIVTGVKKGAFVRESIACHVSVNGSSFVMCANLVFAVKISFPFWRKADDLILAMNVFVCLATAVF